MFPQGNPSPGTSAVNQQSIQLLGNPPIQQSASSAMPLGSFNTTAPQSSNGVASMIKALRGGT